MFWSSDPVEGGYTDEILRHRPSKVKLIELNHITALELKHNFKPEIKSGQLEVERSDYHFSLLEMDPQKVDVVFCAGILYHSPHPFLILENIVNLDPELIFIETFKDDSYSTAFDPFIVLVNYRDPPNELGIRQTQRKSIPYSMRLSEEFIIQLMDEMGYRIFQNISKGDLEFDFEDRLKTDQRLALRKWQNSMVSCWFEKK